MFEESYSLCLHKLVDHVTQNGADGVEPLVGVADISQASLIQENLLHDENCYSFRKLRTRLHDTQAERNYFR